MTDLIISENQTHKIIYILRKDGHFSPDELDIIILVMGAGMGVLSK